MTTVRYAVLALALATTAWPAAAATDYFWNCTTRDGIKYADATQCDKGDAAVKVMKGGSAAPSAAPATGLQTSTGEVGVTSNTGVCPADPGYCTRPNYGVAEGSPRSQAITQFMRKKECDFLQRFPDRCAKSQ